MRIVVTGASGLLGPAVVESLHRRGHEVHGFVRTYCQPIPGADHIHTIDGRDTSAVQTLILDLFPDAIVHAAAVSEVGLCEADPDGSRQLNVAFTRDLARLAHHLGARFLFVSTEQVFDGAHYSYRPEDPVSPIHAYGRQKAEAESKALQTAPAETVVIRAPLLLGNSLRGNRSVHERLFALWKEGRPVRMCTDEERQPCTAVNLASVLTELVERTDLAGIHHWAGAEVCSRYELAVAVANHFRLPAEWVQPILRENDPASRLRPARLGLSHNSLSGILKTRPLSMAQQLEELVVPRPCREWYHSLFQS